MLIKYTCDSKLQTLSMRYPFQSTGRPISLRNGWSFRVYMILLRDFVPEWNCRPGTTTGVNSRRGDSRRHGILWWYHINKYSAMRGNPEWSTAGAKVASVSCKQPRTRYASIEIYSELNFSKLQLQYWNICGFRFLAKVHSFMMKSSYLNKWFLLHLNFRSN